jgi:hypothetical protein
MEETFMLISLILVMLIGSFLAGSIPLFFSFSEDKLKRITVFGAGLLVGTALAVIIPEGVRSLLHENVSKDTPNQTEPHQDKDVLSVIGISLVLGFIFMLMVDQISQSRNENVSPSERNITATIGLVVHAAADGVALGAAATTSHADVEIIVFLAIMLHKAPAAFGLVTFLLHEGIDRFALNHFSNKTVYVVFQAKDKKTFTHFFSGCSCFDNLYLLWYRTERERDSEFHKCDRHRNVVFCWNIPICGHGPRVGRADSKPSPFLFKSAKSGKRKASNFTIAEDCGTNMFGFGVFNSPIVDNRSSPLVYCNVLSCQYLLFVKFEANSLILGNLDSIKCFLAKLMINV